MLASGRTEFMWGVIVALALLVVSMLIWRNKIQSMSVKAGPVQATMDLTQLHDRLERIEKGVEEVNVSVNHRAAGDPTLVARVTTIEAHVKALGPVLDWQSETLRSIAHHVGYRPAVQPPSPLVHAE